MHHTLYLSFLLLALKSYNHFERWQSIWAKKVVRLCVGGENIQSPPLTPPLRGEKAPSQPPPKGRGLLRQVTVPTPNPSPSRGGEGRRRGILCFVRRKNLTGFCAAARRKGRCLMACFPMLRGESANSPRCVAVSSTLISNSQLSTFNFILCSV